MSNVTRRPNARLIDGSGNRLRFDPEDGFVPLEEIE